MTIHTATPSDFGLVKKFHGLALTAMILGIIGAIFGLIPLTFLIAIILGVLAITFGLLGRKHTMGKAGLILGVVALALGIWGAVVVNQAVHKFDRDTNQFSNCVRQAQTAEDLDAC